uniref:Anoctamin n=1 Tax=Timema bartmani TaxID=61472 RepID=A0A7R9EY88_9NEOP|nr:unnamed protein product [Timema bartmani]
MLQGFYTGWLLPAAIVGLLVFLYGVFTMHSNQLAIEVCDSRGQFKMCPLCDETIGCNYWDLSDVCGYARVAYLFDHPGTVFYAVFVSFWAVTFLEYWKRKSASLAHHWDCMGFQEEEERPRPEFAAKAPFLERNPVTGVREPSFPSSLRHKRVAAGIGIIFLMMSLVIIFIVAVIIYRVLVSIPLFQHSTFRAQAQAIANVTGAVVNLCLIMAMSRVYEKLAYRLTTWAINVNQSAHPAPAPVISSFRKWYMLMNKRKDVDEEMRKKKELHVVFGICRLIDVLVPDIPESLELKIKRERYLAKQALQDSDTIMKVASRKDDDYEDSIANGGMVLDLTAELGSLVHDSTVPPPICLADIKNNTSTESQATNQTEASVNTAVTIPRPDRQKGSRPLSEHATSKEGS